MNVKTILLLGLLLTVLGFQSLWADLLISPTRVIFEPRERTKTVVIKNTSSQQKSYRVFFKELQMDDLGIYKEVDPASSANPAAPFVRYSPRLITIPPQQTQTIRLFLRRKPEMNLQEYRSHLAFKEVPPQDFGNVIGAEQNANSVRLLTLFEVTIPLLVKNGPDSYNIDINGLEILTDREGNKLRVVFNRTGESSAYGDVKVTYKSQESEPPVTIGQINRFFVFYPGGKRQIDIALEMPADTKLDHGIIQVFYNQLQSNGGDLIAFTSLNLN